MYLCKDVYERIDKVGLYDRHFEKITRIAVEENLFITDLHPDALYYEEYEIRTIRRECQRADGLCIRVRRYNVEGRSHLITRHTRFKCDLKVGIEKHLLNGRLYRAKEYDRQGKKKQLRVYDTTGRIEKEQNFDTHGNDVCRHVRSNSGALSLRREWIYDYGKNPPEFIAENCYESDGKLYRTRSNKRQKLL
jgi:hypothetical protein